ncbi:MAG: ABC transporter ATP-binding protein [Lysobacterales bacterium]
MTTAALNVKNLSVWLETRSGPVPVVDRISFSINAGDVTGLVGESGCGKTMTARAIMGQLPVPGINLSCDGIEVNGRDIYTRSPRQRRTVLGRDIAMIFQQPATALDPVFTMGQQIGAVYRRHFGGSKQQVRQILLEALESVGFSQAEDIAAAYPHQLSGGMRQLAMIAMATVCKPAVIIADEPTTALDSSSRALILQQLARLQTLNSTAILYISHDLAVVRQNCRDVMVMYCGRIIETTDCESLFSHPRHPYSAGLLACIPQLGATRPATIRAIPGQVPAATDLPPGCHFAPRCARVEARCRTSVPVLDDENGRGAACFRPL